MHTPQDMSHRAHGCCWHTSWAVVRPTTSSIPSSVCGVSNEPLVPHGFVPDEYFGMFRNNRQCSFNSFIFDVMSTPSHWEIKKKMHTEYLKKHKSVPIEFGSAYLKLKCSASWMWKGSIKNKKIILSSSQQQMYMYLSTKLHIREYIIKLTNQFVQL